MDLRRRVVRNICLKSSILTSEMSEIFSVSPLVIHCTGGPSQFNKSRKTKKRNEKIKDLEKNKNAIICK